MHLILNNTFFKVFYNAELMVKIDYKEELEIKDYREIPTDEIGGRFESVVNDNEWLCYGYHGFPVVDRFPLYSRRYANCCGVGLLKDWQRVFANIGGLTHYFLKGEPKSPHIYLFDVLFLMGFFRHGPEGFKAAVIGGDREHFETIKRELEEEYHIQVLGEYCDGWGDGEEIPKREFKKPAHTWKKAHKELLVIPETQEVLMYAANVGYRKLI